MGDTAKRIGGLAAIVGLALAPVRASGDATAYQNDPAHDGSVVMGAFNPVPTVLWSVNTGAQFSYPIIAGNQVFVNAGGQLQAYNALNGHNNWTVNTPGSTGSVFGDGIAYDNSQLYLVSPTGGFDFNMLAYKAANGANVWSTLLPTQYSFTSPVAAANGSAYVGGSGLGGSVYSLRESDGAIQWSESVLNGDLSSPTVTNDGVYVSYVGPQTYKFNVPDGQTIWTYVGPAEGGGGATAVCYDGKLFVSDLLSSTGGFIFNQLLVLNAADGSVDYSTIFGSQATVSPPAFYNNTGYVDFNRKLEAFNINDGSILWTRSFTDGSSSFSAPLVINGYIYEESSAGNLYVIDGSNGSTLDTMHLGAGGSEGAQSNATGFYDGLAASNGLLAVGVGQNLVVLSLPEPASSATIVLTAFLLCRRRRQIQ